EALATWYPAAVNLAAEGATPERHAGALVSQDFFAVIGVAPALGASFAAERFQPGQDGVVLISDAVWRQRFQGRSDIVGRPLQINGRTREIVGVMPPGFQTPAKAAFWVPKVFSPQELQDRDFKSQYVLGRLAAGATVDSARAEVATLYGNLRASYPEVLEGWAPLLHPAAEDVVKPLRPAMVLLLAAVAVVLLLACLNVASLLLAQAATRRGEFGVRAALGASPRRLVLLSLTETGTLSLAGGLIGLALAHTLLAGLRALAPASLARLDQVQLDPTALAFALGACVLTTLIAGLAPALQQARTDPVNALRAVSARATSRLTASRRALVIVQVAATVVVLVVTGLLLRSLDRVLDRDLGFQRENLLTARLELPPVKYAAEQRRDQFAEEVLSRLGQARGVESAAASTYLPLQGWPQIILRLEENPIVRPSDAAATGYTGVTPGYFRTLGMRLLRGRDFTSADREETVPVCVINEAFARTHFGSRDPLGKRLEIGFSEPPRWIEIVGVVNDTSNAQLEVQPQEQVFVPLRQQPPFLRSNPALSLVIRGQSGLEGLPESLRSAVWAVDRDQPLHLLQPMTQILQGATADRRFTLRILAAFAACAVALAAVGLYGMLNGQVTARTRELGVRMVVGAGRARILGLVLGSGALTTLLGMALGTLGALLAGRLWQAQFYQTSLSDPLTWSMVFLTLGSVSLVAGAIPAWRASRLDPAIVLKAE
ncbi:MAG: ABC transporter permease, partial [Verrucomicrobiales bacterium]|nr:ABC transporter permease [Verrucomicrobiales bacterium]